MRVITPLLMKGYCDTNRNNIQQRKTQRQPSLSKAGVFIIDLTSLLAGATLASEIFQFTFKHYCYEKTKFLKKRKTT